MEILKEVFTTVIHKSMLLFYIQALVKSIVSFSLLPPQPISSSPVFYRYSAPNYF